MYTAEIIVGILATVIVIAGMVWSYRAGYREGLEDATEAVKWRDRDV
jgi:hypothetical protein